MNDQKREAFKALAKLVGGTDMGLTRLEKAQRRSEMVNEVCALVGVRHALRAEVVRTAPRAARHKSHVVMARAHAASVLHQAGFKFSEIGRALCADRTTARRMVLHWQDHTKGLSVTVTEDQALAVSDLMKAGMTEAQACEQVGVGIIKFQSRMKMMRKDGKS